MKKSVGMIEGWPTLFHVSSSAWVRITLIGVHEL